MERVSLIISDKLKSPLRCIFGDGELKVSTKTAIGDAADRCPIEGSGGGLEIGFNNRYMIETLKAAPADKIRILLNSSITPCVIVPTEENDSFLYMILPVRIRTDDGV
jgi:DNA polymerase-3 subunit beta